MWLVWTVAHKRALLSHAVYAIQEEVMQKVTRRQVLKLGALGAASATLAACGAAATPAANTGGAGTSGEATGKLEIFSWWTNGGEVDGLNAIYDIYKKKNPNVEIINAAIAGGSGAGGNAKAVLKTRMLGGDPPDSFQVHLGRELIDTHVVADRMEALADLLQERGLERSLPAGRDRLGRRQGRALLGAG